MHKLSSPDANPRKLTQSVIQITEMLGLYQAELARILGIQCGDIGELSSGRQELRPGSAAWVRAVRFARVYDALYEMMLGDGVSMVHWLRADNADLQGVPLLLIVDDGRLSEVLEYLETSNLANLETHGSCN